jgi:tRNA A37 threonylcarbamoyladenosine dehydratase
MKENYWKCRTELLLGGKQLGLMNKAHILIAGLGGVGGFAAEQLCRAGIGKLTLVDNDVVQPSNRNRQLAALLSTQGQLKIDAIANRLLDINPKITLEKVSVYLNENTIPELLSKRYDFIIDAIDTLTPKVILIKTAFETGQKIISSMGSGGKTDPAQVRIDDIHNSHHCKFAYMVRKYLHKYGITEGIPVVYSPEPVKKEVVVETDGSNNKRSIVGTISYMPAIFGCYCAAEAIREIITTADQL